MASDFLQGMLGGWQSGVEARNDVTVAIRNWFANRNPLVTRLPYVTVDRPDFVIYTHKYRPRSTSLVTTAISSGSTTSITVADNTFLQNHDVLSWVDASTGAPEYFQVNGDPNADGTTVTITRAVSGTTAATNVPVNTSIQLIANSRTGGEINQTALTTKGDAFTQYCQNFQFPVAISGTGQTTRAQVLPGGIQTPLDFNMTVQLQNMVDDIEVACYYGKGDAPTSNSSSTTYKMYGIQSILATNNTSSPSNSGAYTANDFVRDVLQGPQSNGGHPDLVLVSPDFMSGFATWGQALMRVPAGETSFGTPIDLFEAPFLNGVSIVQAPLLNSGTAIGMTSSEIFMRSKRNPYWQLRGMQGDMVAGDWLAELAIEVINEQHHSFTTGITAFSA